MTYARPFGKPRGLRARLRKHMKALGLPKTVGLGFVDDMALIMRFLDSDEWLKHLRTSDDPDAARFAAELLEDGDELDDAADAASAVESMPASMNPENMAPSELIAALDKRSSAQAEQLHRIREACVAAGILSEGDEETDVAALIPLLLL